MSSEVTQWLEAREPEIEAPSGLEWISRCSEGEDASVPSGAGQLASQTDALTAPSQAASESDRSVGEPRVGACADSEGNRAETYLGSNQEGVDFSPEALGDLPSIGSVGHFSGECRPCYFLNRKKCRSGADCTHCHYTHFVAKRPGKNHRKPWKKAQARLENAQKVEARIENAPSAEVISAAVYSGSTVTSAGASHVAAPSDFLYSVTPYDPTLQGYQQVLQPAAPDMRSWMPSEGALPQRSHPDQRVGVLLSL